MRQTAQANGVATRTEFLGEVLDMPAFWRSVDVALSPSTVAIESFGMAAVEAMACGRPVVASDNGALPSIVADGETGRVVAPGDVSGLAAALADYANDAELRAEHGRTEDGGAKSDSGSSRPRAGTSTSARISFVSAEPRSVTPRRAVARRILRGRDARSGCLIRFCQKRFGHPHHDHQGGTLDELNEHPIDESVESSVSPGQVHLGAQDRHRSGRAHACERFARRCG